MAGLVLSLLDRAALAHSCANAKLWQNPELECKIEGDEPGKNEPIHCGLPRSCIR